MGTTHFDVLGIGNAIFDVLSHIEDDFLDQEELSKGSMRLVDADEAVELFGKMKNAVRAAGGCAANTMCAISSLRGRAAFIGKVANDGVGEAYVKDLRGFGVYFDSKALDKSHGLPTARSMILVSPDGERTMNTYLGAAQQLQEEDISEALVAASAVTFMEGYLWDQEPVRDAFRKAAKIAHEYERKVAFTLSDASCVDRHRKDFFQMMRDGTLDIIFANEKELLSLYEMDDVDAAVEKLRGDIPLGVVTLGEKGAIAVTKNKYVHRKARNVDHVEDLTGAGDSFAGGFLFANASGRGLDICLDFGTLAAAEIITHMGARPATSLRKLARSEGLVA
jgi:sugar/nucleoside kinase (ribokinase family)